MSPRTANYRAGSSPKFSLLDALGAALGELEQAVSGRRLTVSTTQTGQNLTTGVITGTVSTTNTDDGSLSYRVKVAPKYGTLTVDDSGAYVYTPSGTSQNGQDSFAIEVTDRQTQGLLGLLHFSRSSALTVSVQSDQPAQLGLPPGEFDVLVNKPGGASGYVFYTRGLNLGTVAAGGQPSFGTGYLEIADKAGRAVWVYQLPEGESAMDFAVQTYKGQSVLTWLQCKGLASCKGYIADNNYNIIATVPTSLNGTELDAHEFHLTPEGNALVIGDKEVDADLTAIGGPQNGKITDTVVMVVDPSTGQVVGQWDPMKDIPLTDSLLPYLGGSYDAYHANSVDIGRDGNLLVSLRSTSAIYNVNPYTGEIIYQVGGKNPTITSGEGVQFSGQHDAQYVGLDTIQLFNDDNFFPGGTNPSSIQVIHIDPVSKTATLVREVVHPDAVSAWATGNTQLLPNGNLFGSWGTTGRISEFTADGDLVYEATTPDTTYRVFLNQWTGAPLQGPEMTVSTDGQPTVRAVWNGATEVRQWQVLYGTTPTNLAPIATATWNGLETSIQLPADAPSGYFQVEALDANGAVLGRSALVES